MEVARNSEKYPKFHLTVHQIPSYQRAVVSIIFSFLEKVRYTLTYTVNN